MLPAGVRQQHAPRSLAQYVAGTRLQPAARGTARQCSSVQRHRQTQLTGWPAVWPLKNSLVDSPRHLRPVRVIDNAEAAPAATAPACDIDPDGGSAMLQASLGQLTQYWNEGEVLKDMEGRAVEAGKLLWMHIMLMRQHEHAPRCSRCKAVPIPLQRTTSRTWWRLQVSIALVHVHLHQGTVQVAYASHQCRP